MSKRQVLLSYIRDDLERGAKKGLEEYAQRRDWDDKRKREKRAAPRTSDAFHEMLMRRFGQWPPGSYKHAGERDNGHEELEKQSMDAFWVGFEKQGMAAVVRKATRAGRAGRRAATTPPSPPAAAPKQPGDFLVRQGQGALNWAKGTGVGQKVVTHAQQFAKNNPNVAAVGREMGGIVRRNPVTTAALAGGVTGAALNRSNS